jgi:hypothetical protein
MAKLSLFGSGDQSTVGVPGRAVCRWARCGLGPGQRATRTRTKIELTLTNGSSAKLVEGLPWKLAVALCGWEGDYDSPDWYDTDIPIRVDPDTGRALALDRPLLEEELAARFPIIEEAWSLKGQVRREVRDVKDDVRGVVETPGALRDAARELKQNMSQPVDETPVIPASMQVDDDDPAYSPIEGVTYETWVAVQGGMARDKIKTKARHEYAEAHGVPPGRWDDVAKAWMTRVSGNPGLAIRFRDDLQRATQG